MKCITCITLTLFIRNQSSYQLLYTIYKWFISSASRTHVHSTGGYVYAASEPFLRFYFLKTPFPFPHNDRAYFIYSDLLFCPRLLLFTDSSAELQINIQESAIIYCYRKYWKYVKSRGFCLSSLFQSVTIHNEAASQQQCLYIYFKTWPLVLSPNDTSQTEPAFLFHNSLNSHLDFTPNHNYCAAKAPQTAERRAGL